MAAGNQISLISHKSRKPASGREVNLHEWAHATLERTGLSGLIYSYTNEKGSISLCESVDHKISEIVAQNCEVFVDDLSDILVSLPDSLRKFHIFCDGYHALEVDLECFPNWAEVRKSLT